MGDQSAPEPGERHVLPLPYGWQFDNRDEGDLIAAGIEATWFLAAQTHLMFLGFSRVFQRGYSGDTASTPQAFCVFEPTSLSSSLAFLAALVCRGLSMPSHDGLLFAHVIRTFHRYQLTVAFLARIALSKSFVDGR